MTEIFSSGGGTQSACIAALIVQGRLPKPDFAAIVDTERERSEVWQYHDEVIVPALASVGLTIHRIPKSKYATVDLWGSKGAFLLPAFTDHGGTRGKLPTYCSNEWKQRVLNRFMRDQGVPTREQRRWIGFSLDEGSRYVRMMVSQDGVANRIRFPLIQDVPLTRKQAITEVKKMGWPTPPRSACWMCPNQGDAEWRDLKARFPEEFQKAVELEREVREEDPHAFLHGSLVPLDQVDFGDAPAQECASGACFV